MKGQNFLFDLEGTLVNDIQNLEDLSKRVYYVNPYMHAVVLALIKNGNHVGFWTSATGDNMEKMRRAMSPKIAVLPAMGKEDYEKVVKAYKGRKDNQLTDQEVIEVMQTVYPLANEGTYRVGLDILDEDLLEAFDHNPTYFLRGSKYPQFFLSPNNGFFIDDNQKFIDSATRSGWPENRAVKCDYDPRQSNAMEVSRAIAAGVKL